jgi:tetratricopeptide (TPR) repeat protein
MRRCLLALLALSALAPACGPSGEARSPTQAPLAEQWLERAKASYKSGDFDDARESAKKALAAAPADPDARELAARIALVRLDYAEALRQTEGLTSSQAHGVRGRAYWLSGDIEHAADELEALLADPTVKDAWAHDVAGLARRGVGRHPFAMEGGLIAAVDVPRAIERVPLGAAMVVPCELDGERVLALMATGSSEVLLDSNSRHEPAWVSFRFDRLEINDVPALVQDLSPISRQLGVPIKAMLGAQLLRHAHATFDRRGDQFVVRRRDAPPPPDASRVPLFYMRGGGMLLRATLTLQDDGAIPFYVDSSRNFPLLLKDAAWTKAGVDLRSLVSLPDTPGVKTGTVPTFRMGGFDLAKMPALEGIDMSELTTGMDVDLAGVVGADLLSFFRVTFADDGRFIWIEPDPSLIAADRGPDPSAVSAPSAASSSRPATPSTAPLTSPGR